MRRLWVSVRWITWLVAAAAFGATAEAKFADTEGFSGKHGVDCSACHTPFPLDVDEPVRITFSGLPDAWLANQTYALTIRVDGGPVPNPLPGQPVAGFDLETDGGTLGPGAGMDGLLRFPSPLEATYTGQGTLVREWALAWTAPGRETPPAAVTFWLAVVAANGNHNMDGPEAMGERGDRSATDVRSVDPSPAALAAWAQRPVPAPELAPLPDIIDARTHQVLITGRVSDHADGAEWRLDRGAWQAASGAPTFLFYLPALDAGPHVLEVRAVDGDRTSESSVHAFHVDATGGPAADATMKGGQGSVWLVGLLLVPLALPVVLTLFRPRTR